jgi:hypothetical protein
VGGGLYALISRVEVNVGWNNISYPWPATLPVIAATQKLNIVPRQHFTTIHSYAPTDRADPWKVYDVDAPGWVNDLAQLAYGKGYWFIVPTGGATPPLLASASALDIGVPVPPATFYGVLPYHGAQAKVGLDVQAISGDIVCSTSKTFVPTGTTQVGFLIEVLPAGQGAPAGCGINGQPVRIVIGGKVIGYAIWDDSRPITFRDIFIPLLFGPPAAPLASAPDVTNTANHNASSGNTGLPWIGKQVP